MMRMPQETHASQFPLADPPNDAHCILKLRYHTNRQNVHISCTYLPNVPLQNPRPRPSTLFPGSKLLRSPSPRRQERVREGLGRHTTVIIGVGLPSGTTSGFPHFTSSLLAMKFLAFCSMSKAAFIVYFVCFSVRKSAWLHKHYKQSALF